MIRRVKSQPGPQPLDVAGLPPGTPVTGPMRVVYVNESGTTVSQAPGTPMAGADGNPRIQTGLSHYGHTAIPAGRLR